MGHQNALLSESVLYRHAQLGGTQLHNFFHLHHKQVYLIVGSAQLVDIHTWWSQSQGGPQHKYH